MKKNKDSADDMLLMHPVNTLGLEILDPLGSYTGRPLDPTEQPVQDADDL